MQIVKTNQDNANKALSMIRSNAGAAIANVQTRKTIADPVAKASAANLETKAALDALQGITHGK